MDNHLIKDKYGQVLAMVCERSTNEYGTEFATPPEANLQVGFMRKISGHHIPAHAHYERPRKIDRTCEVLIIEKGTLRAVFYNELPEYVETVDVSAPSVLVLLQGGHEFECLTNVEMIEVKQGPYDSQSDKFQLNVGKGID